MNLEGNFHFVVSNAWRNYRGSFAIVRSAVNKKTGEKVAIKIIDRYDSHYSKKTLLILFFI